MSHLRNFVFSHSALLCKFCATLTNALYSIVAVYCVHIPVYLRMCACVCMRAMPWRCTLCLNMYKSQPENATCACVCRVAPLKHCHLQNICGLSLRATHTLRIRMSESKRARSTSLQQWRRVHALQQYVLNAFRRAHYCSAFTTLFATCRIVDALLSLVLQ